MSARRCLLLIAVLLAYAPAAWPAGDEDDLLAPLTPNESKGKRKKKKVLPPPVTLPVKKDAVEPSRLAVRLPDGAGGPLKDAHLFVDDKEIGVLPLEPLDATPGEHKVAVKRLGYATFSVTVKVKDSGVTELLATLEPLAAVVDLTSEVTGAEVFVDGKSYGPVPVNDVLVAPGSHQFRAKRDGYEEQTQTLVVKAGQDYSVRFSLRQAAVARVDRPERQPKLEPSKPPPEKSRSDLTSTVERGNDDGGGSPWYAQWYVWAGTGAVAAGAVATVVLIQPSNPCVDRQCDACINAPEPVKSFCPALMKLPFVGIRGPVGP